MAWTLPKTWVAGERVVATDMNAQIRDNINYLLTPNAFVVRSAVGALSTTSTTYASLGAGWSQSITTYGGHVLVGLQMPVSGPGTNQSAFVGVEVDGTLYTGAITPLSGNTPFTVHFTKLITGLASASHTFVAKWRVPVGNQTAGTDAAVLPIEFWAMEG